MEQNQLDVYEKEYLPYIIKWGKITCWVSIPLIFLPALALFLVYGARPSAAGVVTGFISLFSAMLAWYIVDPITLYPILHIPGMYMTYIAGNSKEIRAPAATAALSSADVEAGTPEGTIISCLAIATSIFVSLAVMTVVSVGGTVILSMLPEGIKTALNYLLPALFGAMCMQRIMLDYKVSAVVVVAACILHWMNLQGMFQHLPLGGGYAQILLCVIVGYITAKVMHGKELSKKNA